MSVIEVKNVNRSFQNGKEVAHVLKDINLNVEQGEFVSIMGPSGGGKSTLLYLLGGLDMPSSGTVKINNIDLSTLKDKELCKLRNEEVGFVFQFYNLVPNLNVEDNIALLAVVGRRMKNTRGTVARIFASMAHARINVKMIDQGSSELNVIIGVSENDLPEAIRRIYDMFINSEK